MRTSMNKNNDGLTLFFLITFAFSWLLCWIPAVQMGQSSNQFPTILLYILGGCGPSLSGIFLTIRFASLEQRGDFWRSLIDFRRIRLGWYMLILLIFPVTFAISIGLSSWMGGQIPGMELVKQITQQPLIL